MTILAKGCVCGHDHRTARDEPIDLCLECSCNGWTPRCQNCGEPAVYDSRNKRWDACSQRCVYQLVYAQGLRRAVA